MNFPLPIYIWPIPRLLNNGFESGWKGPAHPGVVAHEFGHNWGFSRVVHYVVFGCSFCRKVGVFCPLDYFSKESEYFLG